MRPLETYFKRSYVDELSDSNAQFPNSASAGNKQNVGLFPIFCFRKIAILWMESLYLQFVSQEAVSELLVSNYE